MKQIKTERAGKTLLLDGGDALATSLWSRGLDMIEATNQLGVEVFAPHWEFTYGLERVRELLETEKRAAFSREISSLTMSRISHGDHPETPISPHTIKEAGGIKVGIIGQAFPYTAISHPQRFVPNLTFGIQEDHLESW